MISVVAVCPPGPAGRYFTAVQIPNETFEIRMIPRFRRRWFGVPFDGLRHETILSHCGEYRRIAPESRPQNAPHSGDNLHFRQIYWELNRRRNQCSGYKGERQWRFGRVFVPSPYPLPRRPLQNRNFKNKVVSSRPRRLASRSRDPGIRRIWHGGWTPDRSPGGDTMAGVV